MNLLRGGSTPTPQVIVETVAKLQRYTCSMQCHIETNLFSLFTNRLESDLKAIENQHHIDPRWQPTSPEYLDVLKAIGMSKKQLTKGKLLGVARERVFYLNTLRHHAGYHCYYHIIRIVLDTIFLLFSH